MRARWQWNTLPGAPSEINAAILTKMLKVLAESYSPSVQRTLFEMAAAALESVPEIDEITLSLPNKHYLPARLEALGDDVASFSFIPTDEPHGLIEATVGR
jgi:urate oxidase